MTATPAGITYADYLKLDELLGAQQPLSGLHDEMLFIIIHQTKELWMKQMLHELELAVSLVEADHFAEAYKALARISRIQSVMTLSWDVLSTLTPVDYLAFRGVLGTSSGFQSAQFREFEFRLGLKNADYLQYHAQGGEDRRRLELALERPSLRDASLGALERAGFDLGDKLSALPALSGAPAGGGNAGKNLTVIQTLATTLRVAPEMMTTLPLSRRSGESMSGKHEKPGPRARKVPTKNRSRSESS